MKSLYKLCMYCLKSAGTNILASTVRYCLEKMEQHNYSVHTHVRIFGSVTKSTEENIDPNLRLLTETLFWG